jgi:hypothetical protein
MNAALKSKLTPIVNNIAQEIDCGNKVFLHRNTFEMESYPDEMHWPEIEDNEWLFGSIHPCPSDSALELFFLYQFFSFQNSVDFSNISCNTFNAEPLNRATGSTDTCSCSKCGDSARIFNHCTSRKEENPSPAKACGYD